MINLKIKIYTPADFFRYIRIKLCSPSRKDIMAWIEDFHNDKILDAFCNIVAEAMCCENTDKADKDAIERYFKAKDFFYARLKNITDDTKELIFKDLKK